MKTSRDFEAEFIHHIQEETGKKLDEWMTTIGNLPATGREDIIRYLQTTEGLSFRQATLLASIYLNACKPKYQT